MRVTEPPSTTFKTADIQFAAFLITAGTPFLGCEKFTENKRNLNLVHFVFRKPPNFRKMKNDFYTGQEGSKVPAKTLMEKLKDLKKLADATWKED